LLGPWALGNGGGGAGRVVASRLLIITIMRLKFSLCLVLSVFTSLPAFGAEKEDEGSGRAVIREMNLARQNPALYATFVEELKSRMSGNVLVLPGHAKLRTKEGTTALDEAIRFLQGAQPLSPLTVSRGMSHAAADHCADQADGSFGHEGKDRSHAGQRIARYGTFSGCWGENISYGKSSARDVVLALIIDDGLPARKHRKNIFNPNFNYAGAAFGRHARFGTMCSMDFAGGYAEHGEGAADTLVARNF
ncbi:MAG TPA: CAP domain-containing protein, partial [Chthoniobacterales bacterium]